MVVKLVESEGAEMALDFELGSSVYCKAKVSDVTSVNLWLGAGVMVEYPLEEAKVGRKEGNIEVELMSHGSVFLLLTLP